MPATSDIAQTYYLLPEQTGYHGNIPDTMVIKSLKNNTPSDHQNNLQQSDVMLVSIGGRHGVSMVSINTPKY
jgi:hypothetical protein